MKKPILLLVLFFSLKTSMQSQIAGSFTVPGSFPSVAAAINTLNLTGVAGAVTINILAGYTETVPVGGLKLINPPGSGTTSILFKKQGVGSNPLLLAYSGGTATTNSTLRDGIWMLVDCRNITIDGIDLLDQNTSAPATMEFGFAFYKAGNNGNLNNTIRNCVITLGAPNGFSSRGIDMATTQYAINTITLAPTSSLQANSYNTFHNNLIQKCDIGIYIKGSSSSSFPDNDNDIGGISAVTCNTIINYGGSAWYPQAIHTEDQFQLNASFNLINNNNGFGVIPTSGVQGIDVTRCRNATINSNTITLSAAGFLSQLVGIRQTGRNSTGTVTINNNIFPSLSYTSTFLIPASSHSAILTMSNDVVYVNNNQIGDFTSDTGTITIVSAVEGNTTFINNNSISGATVITSGQIKGISCSSNSQQINNNTIGNLMANPTSTNGASTIMGIYVPSSAKALTAMNNTITNIYGNSLYGMHLSSNLTNVTYSIEGNVFTNFGMAPSNTIGTTPVGMYASLPSTTGTMTVKSNTFSNFNASGNSGQSTALICNGSSNAFFTQNKIYDFHATGNTGVGGMNINATNSHIFNNLIGGMLSDAGGVLPLYLNGGNHQVYFNSICINNTLTTASNSGSRLIQSFSSIDLQNNILVNTSVATGTGITSIISANLPPLTSNGNAFYFGTPGPTRRILTSTPSTSLISAFQSLPSNDTKSFIENPPFISTAGSNSNFLNINPSIATQIEGGATSISTITADFINTVRSATPDVGAWEGNYIAADATPPLVINSGFTSPPCNGSSRTFTVHFTDTSGVASGVDSPRLYYRVNFGLYTSTQGSLSSGSAANGVWTFMLNYAATTGDVIWYFFAFQDLSYLNNLSIVPAIGATLTDINNITVPPNPAYNYTIQTFPTISITAINDSVCANSPYVIQPNGASIYSFLPGNSATVTPSTNTTYTVIGFSSLGCPSTNTVSVNITTLPLPTITVNSGSICAGQSFTILTTGASFYNYPSGSPVVAPLSTSSYTITGSIPPLGCNSLPVVSTVTVFSASISANSNTTQVCSGNNVLLNGSGGINYTWSNSVLNNVPFVPVSTNIYTVTGTTANGCIGTKTIQIIVHPLPTLSLSTPAATVCEREVVTVSVSGAQNYTWNPSSHLGSFYTDTLLNSIDLTVEGSDFNGCKSTTTISLIADPCVGLTELKKEIIRTLPNPTDGTFYIIHEGNNNNVSVRVRDISGRLIFKSSISKTQTQIDISNYPNGVYIVEVYTKDSVITRTRLILSHP